MLLLRAQLPVRERAGVGAWLVKQSFIGNMYLTAYVKNGIEIQTRATQTLDINPTMRTMALSRPSA